jgi:hypothetical protein
LDLAISSVYLQSEASSPVGVTLNISGITSGVNYFTTLGTLAAGATGLQPIIDLDALFPPTGTEQDINFICIGGFEGLLVVRGSMNGVNFTPMASFRVERQQPSLLGGLTTLRFSPVITKDLVRYVQLDMQGVVSSTTVVSYGGSNPSSGGGGGGSGISSESDTGRATTLNAPAEEILYEVPVDLDSVLVGETLTPNFLGVINVSLASTATFRLYIGATTPGDTTGGTVRATITTASLSKALVTAIGADWINPGGKVLAQITGVNNTPATCISTMHSYQWSLA